MTKQDRLEIKQIIKEYISPVLDLLRENRLQNKKWLTILEAKEHTGLSKSTLYRLIKAEEFPIRRIGRLIKINREILDEYMMQGTGGGLGGARVPAKALTAGI